MLDGPPHRTSADKNHSNHGVDAVETTEGFVENLPDFRSLLAGFRHGPSQPSDRVACYAPSMAILLSHTSALEFWRSPEGRLWQRNPRGERPSSLRPGTKTSREPVALESESARVLYSPSRKDAQDALGNPRLGLTRPIHVLVPDRNRRTSSKLIRSHVQTTSLPARYIVGISPGVFAATPELCFIQLSSELPTAKLLAIGFELCGTYRINPLDQNGFSKAEALCTPAEIEKAAQSVAARGARRAERLAKYLISSSASPMETALALILTLPVRYGGYSIPQPTMNMLVPVKAGQGRGADRHYYRCDLAWPENGVAVEYDSDAFHTGSDRIAADAKRRNSLSYLGYHVITVGRQQMKSEAALNIVAVQIAKQLGVRLRPRSQNWADSRRRLRQELLSPF